jgi:hypothetical protein
MFMPASVTNRSSATPWRAATANAGMASRALLFEGPDVQDFDLSRDGKRFLMIESETTGLRLVAVPNWRTELRQLTGSGKR